MFMYNGDNKPEVAAGSSAVMNGKWRRQLPPPPLPRGKLANVRGRTIKTSHSVSLRSRQIIGWKHKLHGPSIGLWHLCEQRFRDVSEIFTRVSTHSHTHFFSFVVVVVLRHKLTHCAHFSIYVVQGKIEESFHQVIIC